MYRISVRHYIDRSIVAYQWDDNIQTDIQTDRSGLCIGQEKQKSKQIPQIINGP